MSNIMANIDQYKFHLYQAAMTERVRFMQQQCQDLHRKNFGSSNQVNFPLPFGFHQNSGYSGDLALSVALLQPQNSILITEDPKPQHSYIGLIAMAILSSPEGKLVLSDIYQHILENYPYFRRRGPGWRNSIRHNLSLNDCFVKSGRSANGKGHYWAIHPANIDDFRRGDFRRRKAQRKVRRHMGLTVEEEPDSPSPPPPPVLQEDNFFDTVPHNLWTKTSDNLSDFLILPLDNRHYNTCNNSSTVSPSKISLSIQPSRKRQFDVASLLEPDERIVAPLISDDETDHTTQEDQDHNNYSNLMKGEHSNTSYTLFAGKCDMNVKSD